MQQKTARSPAGVGGGGVASGPLAAPPARGVTAQEAITFKTIESGEETKLGVPLHGHLLRSRGCLPGPLPGADEYTTHSRAPAQYIYRDFMSPPRYAMATARARPYTSITPRMRFALIDAREPPRAGD